MRVESIYLKSCMSHAETKLELPERGVVCVSGPNGSGKSALVEAVAAAIWGKTLRGTVPWGMLPERTRERSVVRVEAEARGARLCITRSKTAKGSPKLEVTAHDNEWPEYLRNRDETTALALAFGSFKLWRRTGVFSAADADEFMGATDGECKRFTEDLLGLDVFDRGLEACRADVRKCETELREHEEMLRSLRERVEAERRRLKEAEADVGQLKPPCEADYAVQVPEPGEDAEALQLQAAEVERRHEALVNAAAEAKAVEARLLADAAHAAADAERLAQGRCQACGQNIPVEMSRAADEHHHELSLRLSKAQDAAGRIRRKNLLDQSTLREEHQGLQRRLRAAQQFAAERRIALQEQARTTERYQAHLETHERQRTALQKRADEARGKLVWLEEQEDERESKRCAAEQRLGVLRAAEQVLGLRGVRAVVLGKALGGLEDAANAWLDRLRPGVTLRLEATSEQKDGKVVDALARHVDGLGHGLGYLACSNGERRRIDVAVMLALAEVAAAARGEDSDAGTMFWDEALDAIDDEGGLDAAVEVVQELAATRCVVVISHRAELLRRLGAVRRLRVEKGVVTG